MMKILKDFKGQDGYELKQPDVKGSSLFSSG
jgi:hypothetical protein